MRPWHLHELTAGTDLAMFTLYSSVAATFGSPGQGNYAAGNAYLDALAQYRHAAGLAAQSIAWGLWDTDSTMTAGLSTADLARSRNTGVRALDTVEGAALFDAATARDRATLIAAPLDLTAMTSAGGPVTALLRGLVRTPLRWAAAAAGGDGFWERLSAALPQRRVALLTELVVTHVAAVLGHASVDMVDPDRSFNELGFDSLTSVELRNRLVGATGASLPASAVFDHPTPDALARHLLVVLAPPSPAAAGPERAGRRTRPYRGRRRRRARRHP